MTQLMRVLCAVSWIWSLRTNSGCPGSENGYCYPYSVWSSGAGSDTNYYNRYLQNGSFGEQSNSYLRARSVRCVLDLDINTSGEHPSLRGKRQRRNNPERFLRTTATRTLYGQARQAAVLPTMCLIWPQVRSILRAAVIVVVCALIPTPLLCAVSWIWNPNADQLLPVLGMVRHGQWQQL